MPRPLVLLLPALAAFCLASTPLLADTCTPDVDPSPASEDQTAISFYNSTAYAVELYWANLDGTLVEYGLLQPGEENSYNTYIGHQWYVEVLTENGAYCAGPIAPYDYDACNARVWFDGSQPGFDADLCNYMG